MRTPSATPPATVAIGCSLAKAVNLSLASIAASPARSTTVVRPRSSLRASPASTFFLSWVRLASGIGVYSLEIKSIVFGTAVGVARFRAILVGADEAPKRLEDRPAREPEDHGGHARSHLALVLLGVVDAFVDDVHHALSQTVGDARTDPALGEVGPDERQIRLEQGERRVAQGLVVGQAILDPAHGRRSDPPSSACIRPAQ